MNKKIIAVISSIVLVIIFALVFSMCGRKTPVNNENEIESSVEEVVESSEAVVETETEELEFGDEFSLPEGVGEVPDDISQGDEAIVDTEMEIEETEAVESVQTVDETKVTPEGESEVINPAETVPEESQESVESPADSGQVEVPSQPIGNTSCGCEYEKYMAMSAADQQAYMNSFPSVEAFIEWGKAAEIEHENHKTTVTVEGDVLDIGDFIGGE